MKVKIGDRVVCKSHHIDPTRGVVLGFEFPVSATTGEPMPPWVRVLLDRRGQLTFRMQDVEKETRHVER